MKKNTLPTIEVLRFSNTDVLRFWSKVKSAPGNDCWNWTGYRDKDGYGKLTICRNGKYTAIGAHRISYMISNNCNLTPSRICRHSCDNPRCVNPLHLIIGTTLENVLDRHRKGRSAIGSKNGASVLAEADIPIIRMSPSKESISRFGISATTVSSIKNRKTWNHVD
jgi:hypothetical protein